MSTVIKAGHSGPVLKRLATVDLADHLAEARDLLRRARREAVRILEDAQRQAAARFAGVNQDVQRARAESAEKGYAEGYENGLDAGRKAGLDAALEEARTRFVQEQSSVVSNLVRAARGLDGMKNELHSAAERDFLNFVILAVSKMTFAVGRLHREAAAENLKRALRIVHGQSGLAVRVHPSDLESLRSFASEALAAVEATEAITIQPDKTVSAGGCVVESRTTRVDATLETQLDELVKLLVGEAAGRG